MPGGGMSRFRFDSRISAENFQFVILEIRPFVYIRINYILFNYYFPYFTLTIRQTPCFPYFSLTSDSVFSIFYGGLRVFHMTPNLTRLYDSVFSIFFSDVRLRVFHMTPCFPYFYDVRLRVFHMTPCFPYFSLTSDSVFSI